MALTSPIPAISAWTTFRRRSQSDRLLGAAISFTTGTGLGLEQSTILARQGRKGLSSSPEQLHNCCMSPERREENTVGLGMGRCIRCCAKVQHSDNVKIVQNWTYHNCNIFHFMPYTTSYSLFQFSIPRVNNKEGKRVSNALYTPYKMFSESHASRIQKLINQSAQV